MKLYFPNKEKLAQYVEDQLYSSNAILPLTMTIAAERSGVCSAIIATEELSDDTEENSEQYSFCFLPHGT